MTECDHCSEETSVTFVLNHVHFDKSPISSTIGTYTVCGDCKTKLEEDDDVTWSGAS